MLCPLYALAFHLWHSRGSQIYTLTLDMQVVKSLILAWHFSMLQPLRPLDVLQQHVLHCFTTTVWTGWQPQHFVQKQCNIRLYIRLIHVRNISFRNLWTISSNIIAKRTTCKAEHCGQVGSTPMLKSWSPDHVKWCSFLSCFPQSFHENTWLELTLGYDSFLSRSDSPFTILSFDVI